MVYENIGGKRLPGSSRASLKQSNICRSGFFALTTLGMTRYGATSYRIERYENILRFPERKIKILFFSFLSFVSGRFTLECRAFVEIILYLCFLVAKLDVVDFNRF